MVGGFTSSCEAKSASSSEAPSPSHSEQAAYAFYLIQLQQLEWSVASLLPARQKAPLRQKLHPPPILNKLLTLFI
jgi:D-methionine transport system ATP-binding protein